MRNPEVGQQEFNGHVDMLPRLLQVLLDSAAMNRQGLTRIPRRGIYVFFEADEPIYVGRSNRLKDRILEHGRPSSNHNTAPFAFNIAKNAAKENGISSTSTRDVLEKDPAFDRQFAGAKQRVSEMGVKIAAIDDQITQTLFEVYAALVLGTSDGYNSFDNH